MMLSGQCLCGAVRYAFTGTPQLVFLCHCRDCQHSGGSLAHFGVWVPEAGFSRNGEVRSYTKSSDSGRKITREFCPICGSGIDNRLEVAPGVVVIKGGTLDNPAAVAPNFEMYARSKLLALASDAPLRSFEAGLTCNPRKLIWKSPT